jgi:Loader and inhibitor of phage G40P
VRKYESLEILHRIAASYPNFDLTGKHGEKRIEIWCEMLMDMPYHEVLTNVNKHIRISKFPPSIADVAAYSRQVNEYLVKSREWEASVNNSRISGHFKTAKDFLPDEISERYENGLREKRKNERKANKY